MEPDIRPGVRGLTMEVEEVWLGDIEEVVEVETLMADTDCGVEHEVGTEMVVFTVVGLADEGRGTGDETVILPCGGSRAIEEASVLGPGHAPSPVSEDDDGPPWLVGGLVGLGSLALAGAAVVLVRRARRADAT